MTRQEHLDRLAAIVRAAGTHGVRKLSDRALEELPRLYRYASSLLARLETTELDAATLARVRPLVFAAHGILHRGMARSTAPLHVRVARFFLVECPRAIRAEWRLIALSMGVLYGLAAAAWVLVARDLALAYSLLEPSTVEDELRQLAALEAGEPFRGNFTFGLGESPTTAGWIMAHNVQVSLLFFASALVPPFYLLILSTNALMLGAYTAVAGHYGQAGAISSILWCHGTLEIQAILLSASAGLVLLRAVVAPGAWTRAHALRLASTRAARLLAPMVPMLVLAGLIEGFVSPHASSPVRIAVAMTSGAALLAWVLFAGRREPGESETPRARS